MANGISHLEIAEEAVAARCLGKGMPYGKAELDKWFWDYEVRIIETPDVSRQRRPIETSPEIFLCIVRIC